ncbi:MAG: hypothetical protein QW808_00910 [Desulfurococcaceae archaeon]
MTATRETYQLDELRFYVVELELQSIMWFSSITHPHLDLFVQTQMPVIHNYPLLLSLEGQIVEESYVTKYNEYKRVEPPANRFSKSKIYAYPLQLVKVYYRKAFLSMAETDYILYKPKTRLPVPIMTQYNAVAPGTRGRTVVITLGDAVLPRNELYLRLGAKRYGVWRAVRILEAQTRLIKGLTKVSTPFNVADTPREDLAGAPVVILKHYAGDIAIAGSVNRALEISAGGVTYLKPIPFFISP